VTGEDGTATVTGLANGEYWLVETKAPVGAGGQTYKLLEDPLKVNVGDDPTKNEIEVENEKILSGLSLLKLDATDNTILLAGAEFSLYDNEANALAALKEEATEADKGKAVRTLTTGDGGVATVSGLKYGDYWLVETKAPTGYDLLEGFVKVTVDEKSEKSEEAVTIENQKTPPPNKIGSLLIKKVDKADNTVLLKGAEFSLFTSFEDALVRTNPLEEGIVTGEDGTATVTGLANGEYWLVETKAPVGKNGETYSIIETPMPITVNADSVDDAQAMILVENEKIKQPSKTGVLSLTKVDADDNDVVLKGAEFALYGSKIVAGEKVIDKTNKIQDGIITNKKGQATIAGVENGTYFLMEKKAPNGYKLLSAPLLVEVSESGGVTHIFVENKKDPAASGTPSTGDSKNIFLYLTILTLSGLGAAGIRRRKESRDLQD
ncbi:MAG: SpaA isopeptide-forming pilin-related protein, partial [Anaerovoracaceae bacterium]